MFSFKVLHFQFKVSISQKSSSKAEFFRGNGTIFQFFSPFYPSIFTWAQRIQNIWAGSYCLSPFLHSYFTK